MFSTSQVQLINDEGGVFSVVASGTQNVLGTYVQVVASTAHTVRNILLVGHISGAKNYRIAIATGAGGAEVVKTNLYLDFSAGAVAQGLFTQLLSLDPSLIPKGVRVAVALANVQDTAAGTAGLGITLQEAND